LRHPVINKDEDRGFAKNPDTQPACYSCSSSSKFYSPVALNKYVDFQDRISNAKRSLQQWQLIQRFNSNQRSTPRKPYRPLLIILFTEMSTLYSGQHQHTTPHTPPITLKQHMPLIIRRMRLPCPLNPLQANNRQDRQLIRTRQARIAWVQRGIMLPTQVGQRETQTLWTQRISPR